MGYQTQFTGELKFTRMLTGEELAFIKSMFWLESEDYSSGGWICPKGQPRYIQFEFTKDFSGIRWDGSEKFYNAVEAVNFIIANAQAKFPDFGLSGSMAAQGEDYDDRWLLTIGEDGWAKKVKQPLAGQRVKCPHCEGEFVLEGANS